MTDEPSLIDILAPSFGESVTTAVVAAWSAGAGAVVRKDDVLAELETEKIAMQVVAPADGRVTEVLAKAGDTVEAGALLARLLPVVADAQIQSVSASAPVTGGGAAATPQAPANMPAAPPANAQSPAAAAQTSGASTGRPERLVPLSPLRQAVARRLKQAQTQAAILTTFNEADMTEIMKLREVHGAAFHKRHGVKLGYMSFFVRACVAALKEIPQVNTELRGNDLVYKDYYDIGVAVGTDRGLVVPVVKGADKMSLAQLEQAIAVLATKARNGALAMADLQGGTFTITNGGVYGSLMSTPIINAPQSGILGMHRIQQRPMVVGSEIEARPMMYLAFSYDHRIIDGKESVTFLAKIKQRVEAPESLLLDS